MLVFHQSKCISATKRILFYYRHLRILVFFHVLVCTLFMQFMRKSSALRVGEQSQYSPALLLGEKLSNLMCDAYVLSCSLIET